MLRIFQNRAVFRLAVLAVFLLSLAYWIYLVFTAEMQISHDAIGYEGLGRLIYQKGWTEFFKTGPHYEPLYPFTISVSMAVADNLLVPYQLVQKFFQIGILFLTQALILLLLNKFAIDNRIKIFTLLYFGFSPAIVNAALSLFTEIITFPLLAGALLCGLFSWQAIKQKYLGRTLICSVITGLVFVFLVLGRALFEYIFYLFLLPFLLLAVISLKNKNIRILLNSLCFLTVISLILNSFTFSYKLINKKLNGYSEIASNQYIYGLFASVAKRGDELNLKGFLANLSSIPGESFCRRFFSDKECAACGYQRVDYYWREVLPPLLKDTPQSQVKSKILSLVIAKAKDKPLQQLMLMSFEVLKLPFWETTQLGFVNYPPWLQKLFDFRLFNNSLRFIMALLTCCALIYLFFTIFRERGLLLNVNLSQKENLIICFFIFFIFIGYAGIHFIFGIITRYSLRIAPLYIISIAYFLNGKFIRQKDI